MKQQQARHCDDKTQSLTVKVQADDLKLLKALKVTGSNGNINFNTKVELSRGFVINEEVFLQAETLPSGYVDSSTVVLFASESHLKQLSNNSHIVERDEKVITDEAIAAYHLLSNSWVSNNNWAYLDDSGLGFDFRSRPEMFSRMLAAGAFFASLARSKELKLDEPVKIKRSDALDVIFPQKEELVYMIEFFTSQGPDGQVLYWCRETPMSLYWHLDTSGAYYRFESRVFEPICTLVYDEKEFIPEISQERYENPSHENAWDEEDIGDGR